MNRVFNTASVEYLPNQLMIELVMNRQSDNPMEREDFSEWGYTGPGWYFWDEAWSHAHGPFDTRDAAATALKSYVITL